MKLVLVMVALAALGSRDARAQDEAPAPPIVGPPRPPAPPPEEEESPPLDAVSPRPLEAPLREPEEPRVPRFGSAGVVVVSDTVNIAASTTRYDKSDAASDSVTLTPGFDYFVVKGFSVGLEATVTYARVRGYGADGSLVQSTATTFGVGPRFGVNLPISRQLSLFPRLTLAIDSEHREQQLASGQNLSTSNSPLGLPSDTRTGPAVTLFVPLLLHPVPHFFVGAGPSVFHEFGRSHSGPDVGGERTTFGGRFVIGTWWGGTAEGAPDAAAPPPSSRDPRFGDRRELVLTGESGIGLFDTVYDGSNSHTTSVNISPGVDYFVLTDVSLGLGASVQWADQTGLQPTGETVHYQRASYTIAPRVGFNFALGSFASLYPRIGVGGGVRHYDETSDAAENKYTTALFFVDAYVPILLHVAPHAFFGFGPSFSHDLISKRLDGPGAASDPGNRATTVGAGFIVGGWL